MCYSTQSDQGAFGCFVSRCLHLISGLRRSVSRNVVWWMKEDQSRFLLFPEPSETILVTFFVLFPPKNIFATRYGVGALVFIILNCLVSNIKYRHHPLFLSLPFTLILVLNGNSFVFKLIASEILKPQVYNSRKMAWFLDIIHCFLSCSQRHQITF